MKSALSNLCKTVKNLFPKISTKNYFFPKLALFGAFPLVKTHLSIYYKMFLVIGSHLTVA